MAALRGADIVVPDEFDPQDDSQIDAVAGQLLHHFRQHDDRDAFTLLYELCQDRLSEIARRVTRQLGMAVDPEDLVAGYMARLFVDVRKDHDRVRRFLGLSYTALRNDGLNQLRLLRRAHARHQVFDRWRRDAGEPRDPAREVDDREQERELERLGTVFVSIVSVCFHRLPERDRRVLLAREVDGLPYEQIARQLELPSNQVGMILKRARTRLSQAIAATFAPFDRPGETGS